MAIRRTRDAWRALRALGATCADSASSTSGTALNEVSHQCISLGASKRASTASSLQQQFRLPQQRLCWRGFASKAEEYDVISLDAGLAVIEGYDATGFIVNGAHLKGSVLCSGPLVTIWDVASLDTVSEDALAILQLMRPAPDLLILGCGERIGQPSSQLQDWLAEHGVSLECLDTGNAVSTFNILNQEGRKVVAGLLPSS